LKIEGNSFCNAEIFCILGNTYFKFFAGTEKMVDGITAGEDHSRIILDLNFLLSEFFSRDRFKANKRMEIELKTVFP
jgi:hypothetical protein